MRFVVLLFGFAGILLTAVGAVFFMFLKVVGEMATQDWNVELPPLFGDANAEAGVFLGIASLYGFLGTMMAFFRRGKQGALLMIVPTIGAAILLPVSLLFTGLQTFAGLLAIFVGPLPLEPAPSADQADDDDNDSDD